MRKLIMRINHVLVGHPVPVNRRGEVWTYNNPPNGIKTYQCPCGYVITRSYTTRGPYVKRAAVEVGTTRVADVASRPDQSSAPDSRPAHLNPKLIRPARDWD